MKNVFISLFFIIYSVAALASQQPIDMGKKSTSDQIYYLYEYSKMLHENLSEEELDKDLSSNIEANFKISENEAKVLEKGIRFSVKTYRFGKKIYDKMKSYFIAPPLKTRKISDDEFEKINETKDYVDSDEVLVEKNFLRTIPYSFDPQHFKAMRQKVREEFLKKSPETEIDSLRQKIASIDYKSWFGFDKNEDKSSYVLKNKNAGIGSWYAGKGVSARIISPKTRVGKGPYVVVALDVFVGKENVLIYKPMVDFVNSSNLEKAEVFYPTPKIVLDDDNKNKAFYFGQFAIVAKLYPKDVNQNMDIKAKFDYQVCKQNKCNDGSLTPRIVLSSGKAVNTDLGVYIQSAYTSRAQKNEDVIKAGYIKTDGNIVLEIAERYVNGISEVYIENLKTEAPIIKITDYGYEATLKPLEKIDTKNLEILIKIDALNSVFYSKSFEKKNDFSVVWQSFVAGFFINFYPWMICLYSLVLYNLPKRAKEIKKEVLSYGLYGFLALAFFVVTCLLMSYYGVQLQNKYYLITMIFILFGFLFVRQGVVKFAFLIKKPVFFMVTFLLLGLSTNKVFFVGANFVCLAIGFFVPYLVFYYLPYLCKKMPKPSQNLRKISKFINILLLLTIFWLGLAFDNIWAFVVIFVIWLLGAFYYKTKENIESNYANSTKIVKLLKNIFVVFVTLIFVLSLVFINVNQEKGHKDFDKENILIKIEPNWCVLCKVNNLILGAKKTEIKNSGLDVLSLPYNKQSAEYMKRFGIYKPPFYIIYSNNNPNGLVLREFIGEKEIVEYLI